MTVQLSNYLTHLAVDVTEDFTVYRRSSEDAHRAYLSAGAKLLDGKEAAKHGEWTPFLRSCGIEPRTARNMMTLARSGFTAEEISDFGGVRGALESLRQPAKPETLSDPESPPPAPESPDRTSEPDAPPPVDPAVAYVARVMGDAFALSPAARRREERRALGLCIQCAKPSPDHARCDACREKINATNARRRADAETGAALRQRLATAASRGTGMRITAAEVAKLVPTPAPAPIAMQGDSSAKS